MEEGKAVADCLIGSCLDVQRMIANVGRVVGSRRLSEAELKRAV